MSSGKEIRNQDEAVENAYFDFCEAWAEGERPDLDAICKKFPSHHVELRARIEKFLTLERYFRANPKSAHGAPPEEWEESAKVQGKTLGDFHLIKEVGRGGMGVVYEARQVSLNRTVALKVLPAHLTLRPASVVRFKREASTAAKLKHPGIVEIHAIGEAEGSHFIAMEFVEGAPLDRVIGRLAGEGSFPKNNGEMGAAVQQEMHLRSDLPKKDEDTDEGVIAQNEFWKRTYIETVCRVIVQVANALDYTHRAGVIHRDVKPSNILVRMDGSVELTDFGLAQDEGLPSLTLTGELMGTPHYLTPEQASPKKKVLDHRVDIYSLGITLYELLTLTRPFDGRTSHEVLGKIISKAPPLPGLRNVLIPKDLETICLTAMEKDPKRRYQSAKELKDDLLSFLAFQPIRARPVGVATRAYRLIRRNPAYSLVFGLVFLLLVVGPLVFGIQQKMSNVRIRKAMQEKDMALEKEAAALKRAEEEKTSATKVSNFLANIFKTSDPYISQGETITAYDILQKGAASITTELVDQAEVQAQLMVIIGTAFQNLGFYDDAEALRKKALDIFRLELGEEHVWTISALYRLADLYINQDRCREAYPLLETALENICLLEGEESELALSIKESIGRIYVLEDNRVMAEKIFKQIIEKVQQSPVDEDHKALTSMISLASLYKSAGRLDEAESWFKKCLDLCRGHVLEAGYKARMKDSLGQIYLSRGRIDEAESHITEAFEQYRRILGDDHSLTYEQAAKVGKLHFYLGRLDIAEAHSLKSIDGLRRHRGDNHHYVLNVKAFLARIYIEQGRLDEAEHLLIECLEKRRLALGDARLHKEGTPFQRDELNEGKPDFKESMFDESTVLTSTIAHLLSTLYYRQERFGDAVELFINMIEKDRLAYGDDHPATLDSMLGLAESYHRAGRLEEAEAQYVQCMENYNRVLGEAHWRTCRMRIDLGSFYTRIGCQEKAEPCLLQVLDYFRGVQWNENPFYLRQVLVLAKTFNFPDGITEVEKLVSEALEKYPPGHPHYLGLKLLLNAVGKKPERKSLPKEKGGGWESPLVLDSPQNHITLITVVNQLHAVELLIESKKAYDQAKEFFQIEPDPSDQPITLYVTSNLNMYNDIGSIYVSPASCNYPVLGLGDARAVWPISVTYYEGGDDSQVRFTKGLVRYAVVEQYLNRTSQGGEIPDWFKKGQAAKFERYFHPEYIEWSINKALIPLGGFVELSRMVHFFEPTEREIHMAGLICAYLDSGYPGEEVIFAFKIALGAIRDNKGISTAFETLEKALIDDEENIRAFMANHA